MSPVFIMLQMQFANVNMLNTVSQRLASSAPPAILGSVNKGANTYMQDPTYGRAFESDLDKQNRFNEQIDTLLYGGSVDRRYMNMLNGDNTIDRQQKAIATIAAPAQNNRAVVMQQMTEQLPQSAMIGTIVEPPPKPVVTLPPPKEQQPTPPEKIAESRVTEGFEGFAIRHSSLGMFMMAVIVVFTLYLVVQMYISQKRLEMMMEWYASGETKNPLFDRWSNK